MEYDALTHDRLHSQALRVASEHTSLWRSREDGRPQIRTPLSQPCNAYWKHLAAKPQLMASRSSMQ